MTTLTSIPACHGIAITLPAGKTIKVINTHGTQVIDCWAFTVSLSTIITQMSNQHTRATLCRTIPKIGDGLYDNKRRKILTLTQDTTNGIHDTLMAACDEERYVELIGEKGRGHRNCSENLVEALDALGIVPPQFTPSPLNLFMNIPVAKLDLTSLTFEKTMNGKGEFVCLRAEVDVVVALSACPQDVLSINSGRPVEAHFEII